jgi:hypothetical protein
MFLRLFASPNLGRTMIRSPLALGIVAAALFALCPIARANTLSAEVVITGPQNAVELAISITNSSSSALTNANINTFSLTQTAGGAATPVISTPSPILLGTIPGNSTVGGDLIVDFTGADPDTARFSLNATLNADGLTASLLFLDLPPGPIFDETTGHFFFGPFPGTVTTTASPATPLPGALPLFATGLGGLGLLGWRRKRKQAASA